MDRVEKSLNAASPQIRPEDLRELTRQREAWQKRELLRLIYTDWYALLASYFVPGKIVEVGGGSGNFKEFCPLAVVTDVIPAPWVDVVCDAHALPFEASSTANIVLFDVLHHLSLPADFLREAERVLIPGGRIVMMEPCISFLSWPVYRFLHPEPVDMRADPFARTAPRADRRPFDANQAVPTLMFEKQQERFTREFPLLKLLVRKRLGWFAYPLSGGFSKPSLLPVWAYPAARWLESRMGFMARIAAFRLLVVLEKQPDPYLLGPNPAELDKSLINQIDAKNASI